jgi:hypothetical protein
MPNVTMLDLEQLKKTKLRPYIEKSLELRAPDPGFHAMMGHNVDLAESAYLAWTSVFNSGGNGPHAERSRPDYPVPGRQL